MRPGCGHYWSNLQAKPEALAQTATIQRATQGAQTRAYCRPHADTGPVTEPFLG